MPGSPSPLANARAILFGVKTAIPIGHAGEVVLPSEARRRLGLQPGSSLPPSGVAQRIELTPAPEADAALTLAPSRRKVLPPNGQPFDAAAATRDERSACSRRRPDR
jgi:bifunctional DNA-binding transcriptional regulator/antitoxin component of YhaV-PrlF toxin-antitoxin module